MNFKPVKSNQKAEALRVKGCQAMMKGELYEALLKFNKSLCNAESMSETTAMICANRAEVYFKLNLHDNCLNNIELTDVDLLPPTTKAFLDELKKKALSSAEEAKLNSENPWEFFKLSHPANPRLPYVIDGLEVKCDKKFGRYIVSNQDLKVGDILAIEKPFFKILKNDPDDDDEYPESNLYQYCANCLNDNLMDLIPCPTCLLTMFCSPACLYTANKGFHQYECQILTLLNETGNWRMSFRNFFDALTICDGSVEQLESLMLKADETSPTVFDFDFSNPKSFNNAKNQLRCMLSLERKVSVKVKDFSSIFRQHPKLADIWSQHSDFVNKFLERMMQVEILNFHGIKGRSLNRNVPYRSCLGDGGYIFCSLINHSCVPNTMRIVVENRMVLVVERPIKKGEQIFDCYIGDSFYFKSKTNRQTELADYQFLCQCDACENDFPAVMTGDLQTVDKALHSIALQAYNDLRNPRKILSPQTAKEMAIKYSNTMQKHYCEKNYPCREIVLLQLCIIKCFLAACKSQINFP